MFSWVRYFFQLSELLIEMKYKLFCCTFVIIIQCSTCHILIQFPPEMDENWVRYGLAKLGQISRLPNWQRMLFCAYTTQLLHSTGEVCWNNKDSYFIWFEFVCRNSGQIASRRSWKRSCLGLEYTSKCSRLALLWEPN